MATYGSINPRKHTNLSQIESDIPYALRVSTRARSLRIQVRPYVGVEVVVPKRFPRRQIAGILQQHRDWITRQLQKHQHTFQEAVLPQELNLLIDESKRRIEYRSAATNRLVEYPTGLLVQHDDEQAAINLLRSWIRAEAKRQLSPRVEALARRFGFNYQRVRVGSQKSRWGSCSSKGTISLNDQLLFMPSPTVDYLIIHELCHTRHMNHSSKFWRVVEQCCPDHAQHEQRLNSGKAGIPAWFQIDLYRSNRVAIDK
jgi:predicted metal-dependent hydrolase